jgi:hypothetical protein
MTTDVSMRPRAWRVSGTRSRALVDERVDIGRNRSSSIAGAPAKKATAASAVTNCRSR